MIEMFQQDMDEIYLLRRLGSPVIRPRLVDYPKHTPRGGKSANLVRWRTDWQGKEAPSTKPTKQQGKEVVRQLWWPVRYLPTPFKGPIVHGAPILADILIEIDPLDKFQE